MIIGVEKAGTTALFRHLAQCPFFYAHEQREMFYFLSDEEFRRGWRYAQAKYFPQPAGRSLLAKNVFQINSNEAMVRLKENCPDVKCIIMLREPASRAYSAYNYARLRGAETSDSFEVALALEDQRFELDAAPKNPLLYIRNSTYAPKVRAAFDIYSKDHVLIIYHEEYKKDPLSQLERVEKLLGRPLFQGVTLDLGHHNRAAKARSPLLARWTYRFIKSRNPLRRLLRSLISHEHAVQLRHAILNFNRIESSYEPMNEETARKIRGILDEDMKELIDLIGSCPW